jgi:hypothetical protein
MTSSGNETCLISPLTARNTKELTMSMLSTSLNFCGRQVNLKIEPFREISEHDLLLSTLRELFSCFANGYLCRGLECRAFFQRGKAFFVFDPVGIEVKEKKMLRRRAALWRFEEIQELTDELLVNYMSHESEEAWKIGSISCCCSEDDHREKKPPRGVNRRVSRSHQDETCLSDDSSSIDIPCCV